MLYQTLVIEQIIDSQPNRLWSVSSRRDPHLKSHISRVSSKKLEFKLRTHDWLVLTTSRFCILWARMNHLEANMMGSSREVVSKVLKMAFSLRILMNKRQNGECVLLTYNPFSMFKCPLPFVYCVTSLHTKIFHEFLSN